MSASDCASSTKGRRRSCARAVTVSGFDELASLRHGARGWLTEKQVAPRTIDDTLLALNEATTNAIEHAYPGGGGAAEVTIEVRDREIVVTVVDHGSWRTPEADEQRGRGLGIIAALSCRGPVIERHDDGTSVQFWVDLRR